MASLTLEDLLRTGVLLPDEQLVLSHKGTTHEARLLEDGTVQLADGTLVPSLSTAAGKVTGSSTNGWVAWKVKRLGESLAQVRQRSQG